MSLGSTAAWAYPTMRASGCTPNSLAWAALAIAAVAAWALLRWQTGPVKLLGACAIAGLVLHYANEINALVAFS